MQEHINEKKCFKCNCLNLENAIKCVNCGTRIGFNNYQINNEQSTDTKIELINKQIINNEEPLINKVTKKEKNASQMMGIFIGNLTFYSIVGMLIGKVIDFFIDNILILLFFTFVIQIIKLYLSSAGIFSKNILYKNQKVIFINKIRNLYKIIFVLMLVINLIFPRDGFSHINGILYIIKNGVLGYYGEVIAISLATTIISIVLCYIILPRVIVIPLIKKYGTESVNEEVKS